MCAEDDGEGIELHPPQQKLLTAAVPNEREIDCAVPSNVAVVECVSAHSAGKQSRHRAFDPVVPLPADHLIARPKQRRPPRTVAVTCAHEEDEVVTVVLIIKSSLLLCYI